MAIIALTGAWIAFPAFPPPGEEVPEGETVVEITVGTPMVMVVMMGTVMVAVSVAVAIPEEELVADSVGEAVLLDPGRVTVTTDEVGLVAEAPRAKTAAAMMEVVVNFMFVLSE